MIISTYQSLVTFTYQGIRIHNSVRGKSEAEPISRDDSLPRNGEDEILGETKGRGNHPGIELPRWCPQ